MLNQKSLQLFRSVRRKLSGEFGLGDVALVSGGRAVCAVASVAVLDRRGFIVAGGWVPIVVADTADAYHVRAVGATRGSGKAPPVWCGIRALC